MASPNDPSMSHRGTRIPLNDTYDDGLNQTVRSSNRPRSSRSRSQRWDPVMESHFVPGPGAYNQKGIGLDGNNAVSFGKMHGP